MPDFAQLVAERIHPGESEIQLAGGLKSMKFLGVNRIRGLGLFNGILAVQEYE